MYLLVGNLAKKQLHLWPAAKASLCCLTPRIVAWQTQSVFHF